MSIVRIAKQCLRADTHRRESYWDEDSFLDGDYLGDSMCAMSRKMQIYDEEGFEIYEFVCRRERNGEARSSSSRDR